MFRKFFVYSGFNLAAMAVTFLSIPVLTRMIEPEQYGLIGFAISVSIFLFPLISVSCDTLVQIKHVNKTDAENYKSFKSTLVTLSIIIFLFLAIAVFLISIVFDINWIVCLVPVLVLAQVLRRFQLSEFVVCEKTYSFGVSNLGFVVSSFSITLALFMMFDSLAEYRIVSIAVAELLMFALFGGFVVRLVLDMEFVKEIFSYGIPLILTAIPAWFLNEFGRLYLTYAGTIAEVGTLTVAMQFSAIYLQLNKAIQNSVMKDFLSGRKSTSDVVAVTTLYQLVLFSIMFLAVYIGFEYFVGPKYWEAKSYVFLLLVGSFFQSVSLVPSMYLNKNKLNYYRLKIVIISSIINVLGVFALFPYYGLHAILYSFMVSFFIYSFLMFIAMNYHKKKSLPLSSVS